MANTPLPVNVWEVTVFSSMSGRLDGWSVGVGRANPGQSDAYSHGYFSSRYAALAFIDGGGDHRSPAVLRVAASRLPLLDSRNDDHVFACRCACDLAQTRHNSFRRHHKPAKRRKENHLDRSDVAGFLGHMSARGWFASPHETASKSNMTSALWHHTRRPTHGRTDSPCMANTPLPVKVWEITMLREAEHGPPIGLRCRRTRAR